MHNHLLQYVEDPTNPLNNFNLALEYEKINQTASAMGFFLRCAERTSETDLSYECLLHMANCFNHQTRRPITIVSVYHQAISLLPKRPEAYYHLARHYNWEAKYSKGYFYANLALEICNFNSIPLRTDIKYYGKWELIFEKALSSWWWGKDKETENLFLDLYNNYFDKMNGYQKDQTMEYFKKMNIDVTQLNHNVVNFTPEIKNQPLIKLSINNI